MNPEPVFAAGRYRAGSVPERHWPRPPGSHRAETPADTSVRSRADPPNFSPAEPNADIARLRTAVGPDIRRRATACESGPISRGLPATPLQHAIYGQAPQHLAIDRNAGVWQRRGPFPV